MAQPLSRASLICCGLMVQVFSQEVHLAMTSDMFFSEEYWRVSNQVAGQRPLYPSYPNSALSRYSARCLDRVSVDAGTPPPTSPV